MKMLVVALVLALAVALGAYRDAQGKANSRQDTIALLSYRVSALESRASRDELTASNLAFNVSTLTRTVNEACEFGKLVYGVSTFTSTYSGTTVTPQYVYC